METKRISTIVLSFILLSCCHLVNSNSKASEMKNNQTNSIFLFGKTKTFTGIDSSVTELKKDALSAWRTNVYIGTVFGTSLKAKANSSETFDKNKQADGIKFSASTNHRTAENSTVSYTIRSVFTVKTTGAHLFNFNDVGTVGDRYSGTITRVLVNGITRAVANDRLRHQRLSYLPIVLLHLERGDQVHVFVSARIPVNGTDDVQYTVMVASIHRIVRLTNSCENLVKVHIKVIRVDGRDGHVLRLLSHQHFLAETCLDSNLKKYEIFFKSSLEAKQMKITEQQSIRALKFNASLENEMASLSLLMHFNNQFSDSAAAPGSTVTDMSINDIAYDCCKFNKHLKPRPFKKETTSLFRS